MTKEAKIGLAVGTSLLVVIAAAFLMNKGDSAGTTAHSSTTAPSAGVDGLSAGRPDAGSGALTVRPTDATGTTPGAPIDLTASSGAPGGELAGGAATRPGAIDVGIGGPSTRPGGAIAGLNPTGPSSRPAPVAAAPFTPLSTAEWEARLAAGSTPGIVAPGNVTPGNGMGGSGTGGTGTPPGVGLRFPSNPGVPAPSGTGGSRGEVPPATYTVQKGDTLSAISAKVYGNPNLWSKIAQANAGVNSNRLNVGQVLKIPAAGEAKPAPEATPRHEGVGGSSLVGDPKSQYQVQSGDTLEKIAKKLYGNSKRWREIYNLNRETLTSESSLKIGQVLKLPAAPATPATRPA